jgi:hypothetical protein
MTAGIKANADGSGAVQVGGSDAITITSGLVVSMNGGVGGLVSGTAVASTSGTSIDFTSIPSWVKRITVMFNGVSTNGTSQVQIQIGSGSFTTSGYTSTTGFITNAGAAGAATSTSGFVVLGFAANTDLISGAFTIVNITGNTWNYGGNVYRTGASAGAGVCCSNSIALSGTLDRIRVTSVNGTDAFDAGSINILYE